MKKYICYPAKKNKSIWKVKNNGIDENGAFSNVFQICKEKDCNYVIKIIDTESPGFEFTDKIDLTPKEFEREIKKEVCLQQICADKGLCKPVEDWWICDDHKHGVIITSILEKTISEYIKGLKDRRRLEIFRKIITKLHKLHKLGIYHGDFHMKNIMMDKHKNIYFIDMGISGIIKNNDNIVFDYERIFDDFFRIPEGLNTIELMVLDRSSEFEKYYNSNLKLDELENKIYRDVMNFSPSKDEL